MAWGKKQKLEEPLDDAKLIVQTFGLQPDKSEWHLCCWSWTNPLHPTTGLRLLPFTATTLLLIFMSWINWNV